MLAFRQRSTDRTQTLSCCHCGNTRLLGGLEVVQEYVDNGFSGSKDRRPQLDRLMKDAHRRTFDAVLVFKLDRFGRSTSHLIRSLETFQSLGIGFISLTECLDSTTTQGKLMFTMLSAFAEFERSM